MVRMAESTGRELTASRFPFDQAPPPPAAAKGWPRNGARIAPARHSRPLTNPTDTATAGNPIRKLVVPSSGSTAQYTGARRPPPSSPRTGMSGVTRPKNSRMADSLRRSTSVT